MPLHKAADETTGRVGRQPRLRTPNVPELPLVTRVLLTLLGWSLLLVGVAGLVLPGIQGILTLVLGAAVLSLTSQVILRALRWCFRPWPRGWRKLLSVREKVLRWFMKGRKDDAPNLDPPEAP